MTKSGLLPFAAALMLALSAEAIAASATPQGAKDLTASIQQWFGNESGVVTVSPSGETYALKLDFAPYIAKFKSPDFTAEMTPLNFALTDQGGGKWLVTEDEPLRFRFSAPGVAEISLSIGKRKSTAVFDEAIGAFATSASENENVRFEETITPPNEGKTQIIMSLKHSSTALAVAPAGSGSINASVKVQSSGIAETFVIPASESSPTAIDITVTAKQSLQNLDFKGIRLMPIRQLIGFAIAHSKQDKLGADQAELKKLLLESIPLFDNYVFDYALKDLAAATPIGSVGMASIGVTGELNGIVANGLFQEGISFEGLTLPEGLVPPFAKDLIPEKFALSFKIDGFDLAAPAKILIETMEIDESKPLTPEDEAKLLAALLPTGKFNMSTGPGNVTNKTYDLNYEGSMTMRPNDQFMAGNALVKLKGFDALMDIVKAAPPEFGLEQSIIGLVAARGFAKTETDGSLTWKLEGSSDGKASVNGIDLSNLMGGNSK